MRWNELSEENCSFTRTLSVVGDRWTLLILRDCFLGVRRFEDFQQRLGIARGILTDRLRKLTDDFILTKMAYQQGPQRFEYRLTPKGLDLHPVVMSMVHWGNTHMAPKKGRAVLHIHKVCGHEFDPVICCSECGEPISARDVRVVAGPAADNPRHLPLSTGEPAKPKVVMKRRLQS